MYCAIPLIYNSLQVDVVKVVDPRSSSGDLVYEDGIVSCGGTTGCSALQLSSEHCVRYVYYICLCWLLSDFLCTVPANSLQLILSPLQCTFRSLLLILVAVRISDPFNLAWTYDWRYRPCRRRRKIFRWYVPRKLMTGCILLKYNTYLYTSIMKGTKVLTLGAGRD